MLKVMNKTAVTQLKNPVASILCVLLLFAGSVVPVAAQISPARDLTGKWQSPFTCVYYELDPSDPNTRMTDVNARFVVNVNQQGNQVDIFMETHIVSWKTDPNYPYPGIPPVPMATEFTGTVEGARVTASHSWGVWLGISRQERLDGSFTTDFMMLTLTGTDYETDVNGINLIRATLTDFGSSTLVRGSAWAISGDTGEKEPITSPVQMTPGTVIQTGDNAVVGFSYPDQGGVVYLGENSEVGWVGIQQQNSSSGQISVKAVPPLPKPLIFYEEGLISEELGPLGPIIGVTVGVALLGGSWSMVLIVEGILFLPQGIAYVKDAFSSQEDVCYVKPLAVPQGVLLSNGTEFTVNVSEGTTQVQVLNGSVIYVDPITNNTITFGPNQALTLPKAQQAGFSEPELESDVSALDPNSVTRWWPQTTAGGFSFVDYINDFLIPITQPIGNAINNALGNYIPYSIISFLFVDQPIVLAAAILAILIMIALAVALHRRRARLRVKKAKDASSQTAARPPPPPTLAALTASTSQGEKKFAFCPECGEKLPDLNAKFCPFCGTRL